MIINSTNSIQLSSQYSNSESITAEFIRETESCTLERDGCLVTRCYATNLFKKASEATPVAIPMSNPNK
ncbi:unnamed protein product [Rhizophagus irregularis]|nr:unnamed protein product [Rhizophagus irregularis]